MAAEVIDLDSRRRGHPARLAALRERLEHLQSESALHQNLAAHDRKLAEKYAADLAAGMYLQGRFKGEPLTPDRRRRKEADYDRAARSVEHWQERIALIDGLIAGVRREIERHEA
ncbi:MAG: hypothetical protein R3F35_01680 [Myxococcota bacterium]